jgi:hypothetical protein
MESIRERDVQTPWGDPAAEYRGRRRDGTQWRALLTIGESIQYDKAAPPVASRFDAVIDSLCFKYERPC